MPFIAMNTNFNAPVATQVPAEGNPNSRICLVGEAPGKNELKAMRPFVGDAGRVLDHCLHQAGIIRAQCYVTNFIKEYVDDITHYVTKGGLLTSRGREWQLTLAEELRNVKAQIVIPLGKPAGIALAGLKSIIERRGYLTTALDLFDQRKVLPTLHPASCLYGGNYINKYYITHDLQKAAKMVERGVFDYDPCEFKFPATVGEVHSAVQEMREAGIFAFDIEVSNYEVSCISLACRPDLAYSILLCDPNLWTPAEEVSIWEMLASILEDPSITKVGQNLIFDTHFLLTHQHVFVRGPIRDTMIGHHIMYPDFLKGLGFLGSIYCNRPYWKDMNDNDDIKKEG